MRAEVTRRAHFRHLALAVAMSVSTAAAAAAGKPDFTFTYSYPPEAARIPPLRAWFEADRRRLRTSLARDAAAGRRDATKSGYPFNPYETVSKWRVVTATPRFLSLSGDLYSYTGGAHGNPGTAALLWDKAAKRRIAPKDVFVSLEAFGVVVRPLYCAQLKAEQAKRLGSAVAIDDDMHRCPPLGDLTILLGSAGGKRINRIGLIANPYVAGSYAEGQYEITPPVTAAVVATVKPAYRGAFAPQP